MRDPVVRLFTFGARRPLPTLLIILAVTLAAGSGLRHVEIDTSMEQFIERRSPQRTDYERLMAVFGSDKTIIVYLRDAELFSPARLADLEALTVDLEGLPYVERVDSLFTLRSIRYRDEDGALEATTIVDYAPADPAEAAVFRERALDSPLAARNLISDDGRATAVVATLVPDIERVARGPAVTAAVEAMIAPLREGFDEVFQLGAQPAGTEMRRGLIEDMVRLPPLNLVLLVGVLFLFLGTLPGALVPLILAGLTVVWTFGLMGYLGIPINLLTGLLPTLILVVCSTEDTHMLAAYLGELRRRGAMPRRAGIAAMARLTGLPVLLTTATTVLGFFANVFNDIRIVGGFAVAATLAMALNGALTVLAVPLLLAAFGPERARGRGARALVLRVVDAVVALAGRLIRAPVGTPWLLAGVGAVALASLAAGLSIRTSNDPLSFFREDNPVLAQADTLHRDLAGLQGFFVALESAEPGAFKRPENLRLLDDVVGLIEREPAFDRAIGLPHFLRLVHREVNGGDPAFDRVPDRPDLIEQYLLFFERGELERYVTGDFAGANVVVRHAITDSERLNGLIDDLRARIESRAGGAFEVSVVGQNLMINASAAELTRAILEGLALMVAVVVVLVGLVFRSAAAGLLSLVPNLLPIAVMFGVMGLLDVSLNPGTAVVAMVALGIAIDDTMHLFVAYYQAARAGADPVTAAHRAVAVEALPAITTSVALTLGFATLPLLSNFTIVAQFGGLVAFTLLLALVVDLLLTPVLMTRLRPAAVGSRGRLMTPEAHPSAFVAAAPPLPTRGRPPGTARDGST